MNFRQATQYIIQNRKKIVDNFSVQLQSAIENNANILALEKQIRELNLLVAKGKKVDKVKIEKLVKSKELALKNLGLSTTPPPVSCKKCNDTAFIKRAYCACVQKLVFSNQKNITIPLANFARVDYKKMDTKHLSSNKAVYEDVKTIIEKYPQNKRSNIVILGSVGTGKTYLAGCAATLMLERGGTVAALSSHDFVSRCLKYHTTFDENKTSFLDPLIMADLLIIDDLGTEPVLKNVTHEYLYIVLSERLNRKKLTFITSNLSFEGIYDRYGERIYSRLKDKANSFTDTLNGKDLRL